MEMATLILASIWLTSLVVMIASDLLIQKRLKKIEEYIDTLARGQNLIFDRYSKEHDKAHEKNE